MRLSALSASGLLSFEDFRLTVDPKFTVLVGPNGAGKSNLLRLPDLVTTGLLLAEHADQHAHATLEALREARHPEHRDGSIRVSLDISLTDESERELVTSLMQAATFSGLHRNWGQEVPEISRWVLEEITTERLAPLHQGTVTLHHPGYAGASWAVTYGFDVDGTRYRWTIGHNPAPALLTRADQPRERPVSTVQTLRDRLVTQPIPQPPVAPAHPFDSRSILPHDDEGVEIGVDLLGTFPLPEPQRRFADRHGIDRDASHRSYTFALTLLTILNRGIVRLHDARLLPGRLGVTALGAQGGAGADGDLPTFLFHLKNGAPEARRRYRDVQKLFAELSRGRVIEVGEPQATSEEAPPLARVSVHGDFEVPIEFAGSGAWELLVLASTIGHPGGTVLLLDEPGASLHPTLQAALVDRLSQVAAQVITVTHSPAMLPLAASQVGPSIVRIDRQGLVSRAWTMSAAEYKGVAAKLRAKGNQGLPFAEHAILCEGEDDVAVVRILAERLGAHLGESNVMVVDCGGRPNLPDYIRLCSHLHLLHLVIMDDDSAKVAAQPGLAKGPAEVRKAMRGSPRPRRLFSFREDIETAFGLPCKDRGALETAARRVALDSGEPRALADVMRRFLAIKKGFRAARPAEPQL